MKINLLSITNLLEYDETTLNIKAGIIKLPIVYHISTTEGIKITITIDKIEETKKLEIINNVKKKIILLFILFWAALNIAFH